MGRLEDRLLNHPAREQIAELRRRVAELDEDARAAAEKNTPGVLERAPQVGDYIEGLLNSADPALVTDAALAAIEKAFTRAAATLTQLAANPATAANLNGQLEAALAAASPLATVSPVTATRAKEVTKKFSTALTQAITDAQSELGRLQTELAALDERRAQLGEELTAAAEERRAALQNSIQQLDARINAEQQRLDQLVPTFEKQFTDDQESRRAEFNEVRDKLQKEADDTTKVLTESADKINAELEGKARETLEVVDSRREDVERLYGVITDTATAGAFNKEAGEQKKAADTWRRFAIGFGLAAALLAVGFIIWAGLDEDAGDSVGAIVAKVTATLAAAGIAAYAGRQSGRHREREEEAKRLELDLVALGPFLEDLGTDEQQAVRKAYSERAFTGRGSTADGGRGLFGRKHDTFGLTPELITAIAAAARSGGSSAQQ